MDLERRYEFRGPKWSPDGRSLVYVKNTFGSSDSAIEARSVADGSTAVLVAGKGLLDFWWTADARLIYSQAEPSEEPTYDLWELRMDGMTPKRHSSARRLTRWVGYSPGFVSVSADGKRIVTTKGYTQSDVYVAELEPDGRRLKPDRRLTLDARSDWPGGWTRDGKDVLFYSDRNGAFNLFRQAISGQSAEQLMLGTEDARTPQITADGQWLLYLLWPDVKQPKPVRLMRYPLSGGTAQTLIEARGAFANGVTFSPGGEQDPNMKGARSFPDFRCPASSTERCVLAEADHEEVVFTYFDPVRGRGAEAARVKASPAKFWWDLSPDGMSVAYGEFKSAPRDYVTILTLGSQASRQIPAGSETNFNSISWSSSGRELFLTTTRREGSDLLRLTLDGKVDVLRQGSGRWFADPRPSPDGRLLAFAVRTTDSNVWLIERK